MGEQFLEFLAGSWKWLGALIEVLCVICFTVPKIRNKIKDALQNFIGLKGLNNEIKSMKEQIDKIEKTLDSHLEKDKEKVCEDEKNNLKDKEKAADKAEKEEKKAEKEVDKAEKDLADKKKKYTDCLAKNKQDEIIGVIEQLDAKEYDLLHKVYVQYYDLKQYQYMKHISYSSTISIHGRALNKVWEIVGKEEANEYKTR